MVNDLFTKNGLYFPVFEKYYVLCKAVIYNALLEKNVHGSNRRIDGIVMGSLEIGQVINPN